MQPAGPRQEAVDMKNVAITALILAITGIVVLIIWLWVRSMWQTIPLIPEAEARISSQIELIKTVATIFLGVGVLGTLYLTWRRVNAAERTIEVAREGQITERFTRAIDQLGSDKVPIRLGGIYALERVARDSAEDHWPVMQVLVDCVPRRPSQDQQPVGDLSELSLPADVQAILTVLGRLNTKHAEPGRRLNLRRVDLRGADLRDVNFREAILIEADLCGALLDHANLQGANLGLADCRCTILQNANLRGARLALADFRGTDLTAADLRKANLDGADFQWGPLRLTTEGIQGTIPENPSRRTHLNEADLRGATLRNAYFQGSDLTNADFEGADLTGSHFGRAFVRDSGDPAIDDISLFNTVLTGANFRRSNIRGADFRSSVGLTRAQVNSAISDEKTRLRDCLSGGQDQSQ